MLHDSLLMYGVRHGGLRRGVRAIGLLTAWAAWVKATGEPPSPRVLGGETERSRASYYRDLEAFKACFPGEVDPTRLSLALLEHRGDVLGGPLEAQWRATEGRVLELTIVEVGQVSAAELGLVA